MSVPYASPRWPLISATTAVWALAAASIVFWGLRLAAPREASAPPVAAAPETAPDPALVAQLLGAVPTQARVVAAPDAASRFVLFGVVADADQQGAALIAVDGKPPRPYRVGATLADGYVLQSLDKRAAAIGSGGNSDPAFSLQLPARPLAANPPPASALSTGVVPAVTAPAPQAQAPAQPAMQPPPQQGLQPGQLPNSGQLPRRFRPPGAPN